MLPNMHPADELSLVRAELRRLREREQQLRDGFLSGDLPRDGAIARVNLTVQRRRMLKRDQLPSHIQNDPRYWQMRESRVVEIEDRETRWEEDAEIGDVIVVEPFDA